MALKQKSACVRLWLAVVAMVLAGLAGDVSRAATTLANRMDDPASQDKKDEKKDDKDKKDDK